MDLKIEDVADLLNVSQKTLRRWVTNGDIPSYSINEQQRFNRTEIENWVINQKIPELIAEDSHPLTDDTPSKGGIKQFSFFRALHKGDVLVNVPGNTKEEVIRYTMQKMAKKLNIDAEVMTELLLDREKLQATALNNGIGLPHTRDSHLNSHFDVVIVVYPETPLEYGALDEKPVHTLFFLFACDDKRHLNLLAKIAHLANNPITLDFLKTKPEKDELLSYVKEFETNLIAKA